ncbi:MAG: DUF2330 domain-containing protein [Kofleriaceae bacterium]
MLPAILAFCGFYVASSDQPMFNDATQVVLMRDGTRTVLSMQNNYKGPPDAFAMVVPVPTVLHEGDVKTLAKDVFDHVEKMGAPRLVEYWEQDPCAPPPPEYDRMVMAKSPAPMATGAAGGGGKDLGVKIEAQFTVGEYQIVILSAKDSSGLETWLHQEKYNIPAGAEPLLRPYVEGGMKFFVAKVDPAKVQWVGEGNDKHAALSPLRFHYDSDRFDLPIRLGLANSQGTQDLIVNILATERYETANYPNTTIPTNIDLNEGMKDKFAGFYAALFDNTLEKHPGNVITEYAWNSGSCDPCPGPTLQPNEIATLGGDILQKNPYELTLTRMHARYGKDIKDDLVFKAAKPIVGGREFVQSGGKLESGAQPSTMNNFQARYAIRHAWQGPIKCTAPVRNRWGGPWAGQPQSQTQPATGLAFAKRDEVKLVNALAHPDPQIDLGSGAFPPIAPTETGSAGSAMGSAAPATSSTEKPKKKSGCGCQTDDRNELGTAAFLVGVGLLIRRRRKV